MRGARAFATAVRPKRVLKAAMEITPSAARRVKGLLEGQDDDVIGIRLNVRTRGCNGLSYVMDYAKSVEKFEDVVEQHDVKVLIAPKAFMHLVGTKMDYVEDELTSEFVFHNPNSKGECGCGESFNV